MVISPDVAVAEAREVLAGTDWYDVGDLLSDCRLSELVRLRHAWWQRLAALGWTASEIGRHVGRHHTTILHALRKEMTR